MKLGTRVRIEGTNSIFDGKEGILEEQSGDNDDAMCVVFVDFIPDENKRIRQNFALKNILQVEQPIEIEESKKHNNKNKSNGDIKNTPKYNLSSLVELKDVMDNKDFKYLTNYPYAFKLLVSTKFVNGFNFLRKTIISSDKHTLQFLKLFDRVFARLDDFGIFKGVSCEKVNGLANKYNGNIKELKLGEIDGKPIRILYFTLSDKTLVLGNIFYHKGESLNNQERTSINDIYDNVKNI